MQITKFSYRWSTFFDKKCNKFIRQILTDELYSKQYSRTQDLKDYDSVKLKKLRTEYLKYPILPKSKEIHFKVINNIYPSSEFLRLRFNFDRNECIFCKNEVETTCHIFYECNCVRNFWSQIQLWLERKNIPIKLESHVDILYGMVLENKSDNLLVNVILILAKHYIHYSKFFKSPPAFKGFINEFKLYYKSIKFMKSTNATELLNQIQNYNLIDPWPWNK